VAAGSQIAVLRGGGEGTYIEGIVSPFGNPAPLLPPPEPKGDIYCTTKLQEKVDNEQERLHIYIYIREKNVSSADGFFTSYSCTKIKVSAL
jgi:hypothetical protein